MHLNDQQLLAPDEQQQKHLCQCSDCQQRLDNLTSLRQRLRDMPVTAQPDKALHERYFRQQIVLKNSRKNQSRWFKPIIAAGVGIAASIFLTIQFLPVMYRGYFESTQQAQVQQLIASTQKLLNQLYAQSNQHNANTDVVMVLSQARILDAEIQQAYFNNMSDAQIKRLWKKKLSILNNGLKKHNEGLLTL